MVPAAHYACGGVRSDLFGQTSVPGLLAIGETGCTGLHGANRLAANSLLDAVVVARNAARRTGDLLAHGLPRRARAAQPPAGSLPGGGVVEPLGAREGPYRRLRESIRRILWDEVGIVRREPRLRRAASKLAAIHDEFASASSARGWSEGRNEIRNLLRVGALIVESALHRRESRGLHQTLDHPAKDPALARDTLLVLRDPAPLSAGGPG